MFPFCFGVYFIRDKQNKDSEMGIVSSPGGGRDLGRSWVALSFLTIPRPSLFGLRQVAHRHLQLLPLVASPLPSLPALSVNFHSLSSLVPSGYNNYYPCLGTSLPLGARWLPLVTPAHYTSSLSGISKFYPKHLQTVSQRQVFLLHGQEQQPESPMT